MEIIHALQNRGSLRASVTTGQGRQGTDDRIEQIEKYGIKILAPDIDDIQM
jgi:hypothetical protein